MSTGQELQLGFRHRPGQPASVIDGNDVVEGAVQHQERAAVRLQRSQVVEPVADQEAWDQGTASERRDAGERRFEDQSGDRAARREEAGGTPTERSAVRNDPARVDIRGIAGPVVGGQNRSGNRGFEMRDGGRAVASGLPVEPD